MESSISAINQILRAKQDQIWELLGLHNRED